MYKACRERFGYIGIALGIQRLLWAYRNCFGDIGNALGAQELLRKSALGGEQPSSSAASPVCGWFRWRETPAAPAALLGTVGTKQMAAAARLMDAIKRSLTAARVFWPAP